MGYINLPPVGYGTWKSPINDVANLPVTGNLDGDARVVSGTGGYQIYVWDGASNQWNLGSTSFWTTNGVVIYPISYPVSIGTTTSSGKNLQVFQTMRVSAEANDYIDITSQSSLGQIYLANDVKSEITFLSNGNEHIFESTGTADFVFKDPVGNIGMAFNTSGDFYANKPTTQGNYTLTVKQGAVGINNTSPSVLLDVVNSSVATSTVTDVLRLNSQSTLAPAVGIGVGVQFAAETAAGNTETGARIAAFTTNNASGAENFDLCVYTMLNGNTAAERLRVTSGGDVRVVTGNLSIFTAGKGLRIREGTNAKMGVTGAFPATNPNTVTVATTNVAATSRIFLTVQSNAGGHQPDVWVDSISAGVNFVIKAHDVNFAGTVAWLIVDPAN